MATATQTSLRRVRRRHARSVSAAAPSRKDRAHAGYRSCPTTTDWPIDRAGRSARQARSKATSSCLPRSPYGASATVRARTKRSFTSMEASVRCAVERNQSPIEELRPRATPPALLPMIDVARSAWPALIRLNRIRHCRCSTEFHHGSRSVGQAGYVRTRRMGFRQSTVGFTVCTLSCVAIIASACADAPRSAQRDDATASISISLSGGDFTGNSIRICGSRDEDPDDKYRCEKRLPAHHGCGCFEFDASGAVLDPQGILTGLCPSADFPTSTWTFFYEIWSDADCSGTILNDFTNPNNLVCFDSHDLNSQANPNQSVESLAAGANANQILCVAANARKSFRFGSCAILDGGAAFDCGCSLNDAGTACDCPGGLSSGDLESGCTFDETDCSIVCVH